MDTKISSKTIRSIMNEALRVRRSSRMNKQETIKFFFDICLGIISDIKSEEKNNNDSRDVLKELRDVRFNNKKCPDSISTPVKSLSDFLMKEESLKIGLLGSGSRTDSNNIQSSGIFFSDSELLVKREPCSMLKESLQGSGLDLSGLEIETNSQDIQCSGIDLDWGALYSEASSSPVSMSSSEDSSSSSEGDMKHREKVRSRLSSLRLYSGASI